MDATTIISLDNIGTRMCIREGMKFKSCTENNWNDELQCTLLSVSLDDQVIDSPGHVYTYLGSWTMDFDSCWPNPCPNDTKCALSKSNGYVCLSYDCPSITLYSCEFETDAQCIFKNSSQDDFDWIRHSGTTSSQDTGPTKAAGGSYYIYIEVSGSGRSTGDRAVLTTEAASLTARRYCLSFQYHMMEDPGTLKVFAGDKTSSLTSIWEKTGVQPDPDQWKNVTIEIPQFNNPVITIEGTRGGSFRGDIAIDDLILNVPRGGCSKCSKIF